MTNYLEDLVESARCSHCAQRPSACRCYEPTALPPNAPDFVNSPPHYRQGDIECIDAIKAQLTPEEFRGYCKGNAAKYLWRCEHKGGKQDIEKSAWYISKLLEVLK